MAMHVLAVARSSPVRVVGLCHGVRYTRGRMIALARLAEMDEPARQAILADHRYDEPWQSGFGRFYHECVLDESVETFSAGINHMAAFLVFRQGDKDLYPALRKAYHIEELRRIDAVRLELMHQFGYFMTETSGHISEYLPWFLKDPAEVQRMGLRPLAYLGTCQDLDRALAQYRQCAKEGREFIAPDEPVSIEYCSRILNAIQTGRPYVFNGNVHNAPGALIANLPADSCVEVPIVADRGGLRPTRVGELPPQIAAMIRTNINVQDLTVRAVMERRRELLYHAAMLDPNLASTLTLPRIRQLVDEMIAAHGELIPAYLR
jgi:alpha-galactosidase